MDGIGTQPRLRAESSDGSPLIDKSYAAREIGDVAAAIATTGDWLRETQTFTLAAVGHRVAHGGPQYDRPVIVDRCSAGQSPTLRFACAIASAE